MLKGSLTEIFHFEPTLGRNYQEANLSNSGSMRTLVFMSDVRLTLPVFLIACLLGCQEERASGALYLTWKFGAFSCEQAAVTNVSAKVYNYDGYEAVVEASGDCEAEGLQVQDVPAGDYTLVLQGLNADGCATHEVRRDVKVPEGTVNRVDELALLRRHRDLTANWYFENRLDCLREWGSQVEIQVVVGDRFDETYLSLCEGFQSSISDKLPLGELTLTVRGIDGEGNSIAYGSETRSRDIVFENPCEDTIKVEVPMQMCDLIDCEDAAAL